MLQKAIETDFININCVDPLGRSALLMAIDNENLEMVELLIEHKVETKDALLHAISEEFVEAVEVLLDHENTIHKVGDPHVSNFPFHPEQHYTKTICNYHIHTYPFSHPSSRLDSNLQGKNFVEHDIARLGIFVTIYLDRCFSKFRTVLGVPQNFSY